MEAQSNPETSISVGAVLERISRRVAEANLCHSVGTMKSINQTCLEVELDGARVGEMCSLVDRKTGTTHFAKVTSIRDSECILLPLGSIENLSSDAEVRLTGRGFQFPFAEGLLGHVVNGMGEAIDGYDVNEDPDCHYLGFAETQINPLSRPPIDQIFQTGIRTIDGFNTLGEGQRIGLFGDPGCGKSTLLASLARYADFDVCVLALIGERGREVREFLERQLPPEFRPRCIVVASTSDTPAMQRIMGGQVALAIAEHFRDNGKRVLLLFDSVTRYARALREVGLASGERAVRRGYTPSVYADLPKLIERCGRTETGVITAIFSVLTENEGFDDPIAEEVRSLTDGHLILSAALQQKGQYPAVDVLKSRSRLMAELVNQAHIEQADHLRSLLAKYLEIELLLQVGEYKPGGDPLADEAVKKHPAILQFLKQGSNEETKIGKTAEVMEKICEARSK